MSADTTVLNDSSPAALPALQARRSPRRLRKAWRSVILTAIPLVLYIGIAAIGPLVIAYDPITVQITQRLKAPGTVLPNGQRAILGTDQVGRDVLAQVVRGARVSLFIGLTTVVVAGLAGSFLGLIAGYFGKGIDNILMRLADIQLAFPSILLAILIAAVLGPSVTNVIITLSFTRWVVFARVARAATLVTKEREFVTATRASGAGTARILLRHITPALVAPFLRHRDRRDGCGDHCGGIPQFPRPGDERGAAKLGPGDRERAGLPHQRLVDRDDAGHRPQSRRPQRRRLRGPLAGRPRPAPLPPRVMPGSE